jgi:hypothetical protein
LFADLAPVAAGRQTAANFQIARWRRSAEPPLRLQAVALVCAVLVTLLLSALPAGGGIIGHSEVDGVATLPQTVMDAIGRQKWLFTHASVGGNMIEGMQALSASNANRYRLVVDVYGDGSQVYPPPATTIPGTIYDAPRGNPGWQAKFNMFNDAVRSLGWHDPKIGIAMDKLCYIDQDANPTNYIAMMTALEADFPGTILVYTTMPLESSVNPANILRAGYNNIVRAHCLTNNRVLFDIADIESHDPAGNAITFTNASKVYERMYSGYTTDGGHLNALGEQRVALGWYATAAALTPVLNVVTTPTNTLTLSWPAQSDGMVLEYTNALPPVAVASWPVLPLPYQTNAGVISVTVTNTPAVGNQFFRLHKP